LSIHYHCRHCGTTVGTIEQDQVNAEQLGFHKLTNEEREELIQYSESGDIHVKCICDDCHEAFSRNPLNYENDYIIH